MAKRSKVPAQGEMLQGTLDLLVLKTLALGPAHGHYDRHHDPAQLRGFSASGGTTGSPPRAGSNWRNRPTAGTIWSEPWAGYCIRLRNEPMRWRRFFWRTRADFDHAEESHFWRGRRQLARGAHRFESHAFVRSVAERLVFRVPAAAQADGSASGEAELIAVGIVNREVALDADGAVVENDYFRWHYPDANRSFTMRSKARPARPSVTQSAGNSRPNGDNLRRIRQRSAAAPGPPRPGQTGGGRSFQSRAKPDSPGS